MLDRHGLEAVTDRTISDCEGLCNVLEEVRKQGFAFDDEERVRGTRCVAEPILIQDDYAIAAVSVSGPKSKMREERFREDLSNQDLRSANVIEVNLAYSYICTEHNS
nr:IclR family transcriptional regulator C-terminal domain-containing protein [Halocatena marina]